MHKPRIGNKELHFSQYFSRYFHISAVSCKAQKPGYHPSATSSVAVETIIADQSHLPGKLLNTSHSQECKCICSQTSLLSKSTSDESLSSCDFFFLKGTQGSLDYATHYPMYVVSAVRSSVRQKRALRQTHCFKCLLRSECH